MHREPDRMNNRGRRLTVGQVRGGGIFARGRVYDLTNWFGLEPGWRNGIRRGLKILWSESSVRVRPPPPALKTRFFAPSSVSNRI